MKTNFEIWRDSDNVIKTAENGYRTQCGQYKKEHTEDELKAYFIKEYCDNNKERADEIADLFEHYDELPQEVQSIIDVFNLNKDVTENGYDLCKKLVSELEIQGYTCEYGLDAEPYNLQKLEPTEKFARKDTKTGKGMNEGFCVGDGDAYFEEKADLIEYIREHNQEEYKGFSDKKMLKDAYKSGYYYWTDWYETIDESEDTWYDADGNEFKTCHKCKEETAVNEDFYFCTHCLTHL